MSNACDVRVGDRYKATVKPNFPDRRTLLWIAVRIDADDEDTVLVEDEDDEEVDVEDKTDDEILTEWAEVVTDDRQKVVTGATDTDKLMKIRDQMFTTLLHMSNGEFDDMVLDVLSVEPMGFVDVLGSYSRSIQSNEKILIAHRTVVTFKVQSSCVRLCKAGKLVEASYTTHNSVGKAHTTIVYARRMEQVNPTRLVIAGSDGRRPTCAQGVSALRFLDISCYAENHVTTEKATSFPLETVASE